MKKENTKENEMNKEDLDKHEDSLRARGYYKLYRRSAGYLLKTRTDVNGMVTARIIVPFKENLARKEENVRMKIDFKDKDYAWIHPDQYADTRGSYVVANPDYIPLATEEIEVKEEELVGDTQEVFEEDVANEKKIEKTEKVEDIFADMTVDEMRQKCKERYSFKLPKTIKNASSAIKHIKKFLED